MKIRWIISLLAIYSCALMYSHRAAMSLSIIRMTKKSFLESYSQLNEDTLRVIQNRAPVFDWNQKTQGIVLGSTYYLYWLVPIFAGYFTDRFGGKWAAMLGVLGPCILIGLVPLVAQWGLVCLIFTQTLISAFHGLIYPSFFSLFIQWFPANERSKANANIQAGSALGSTIMFTLGGLLCETSIGWPLIFYLLSAAHVPWILLWLYFGDNRPVDSRRITEAELKFILAKNNEINSGKKKSLKVPWKSILTSKPVWCSVLSRTAGTFGFYLLYNKTPSYLSTVHNLNIIKNGYFNACMNFAYGLSSFLAPFIANCLIDRKIFSSLVTRKLFESVALVSPALCFIVISLEKDNASVVIALLVIGLFLHGCWSAGEWTMISEYAPNLSGVLTGFCMFLPYTMPIITPYAVGIFIDSNIATLPERWSMIFYFTSGVFFSGALIFLLFSTNQQQRWDRQVVETKLAQNWPQPKA